MKTIIAGCRDFTDYRLLKEKVDYYRKTHEITEIVCGMAQGADNLGMLYATDNNITITKFPADWDKHGKAAGPIRNREMAYYADVLIAVWDGKSKGTKNMIDEMNKLMKPTFLIWIGGPIVAQGVTL